MTVCLYCGKELSNQQRKYCSIDCQTRYIRQQYILKWQRGEIIGWTKNGGMSKHIRTYMLEKFNYKCQKCGWGEANPITLRVPLEVHHIDGDCRNCQETNLEVLCPNCHSLTPNFGSLNKEGRGEMDTRKHYCIDCGVPIVSTSLRCTKCAPQARVKTKPITRDRLKMLIRTVSFVQIGKEYGVTDNAVRKWCIGYNLPIRKRDIDAYIDEEWEKI